MKLLPPPFVVCRAVSWFQQIFIYIDIFYVATRVPRSTRVLFVAFPYTSGVTRYFRFLRRLTNATIEWNYTESWRCVTYDRCSVSFVSFVASPLSVDSSLMPTSNVAANPIKRIQLLMSCEWRRFWYGCSTCTTIDVLSSRLRNWIRNDSVDAYSRMDKLMLLLAHPRCIAAGCSPNPATFRQYRQRKKHTYTKNEKQIQHETWARECVCGK